MEWTNSVHWSSSSSILRAGLCVGRSEVKRRGGKSRGRKNVEVKERGRQKLIDSRAAKKWGKRKGERERRAISYGVPDLLFPSPPPSWSDFWNGVSPIVQVHTTYIFLLSPNKIGWIFTLRPTRPHFLTSRERRRGKIQTLPAADTQTNENCAEEEEKEISEIGKRRSLGHSSQVSYLHCTPFLWENGFPRSVARYVCVGSFCDDDNKRRKGWEIVWECDRTEPKSSPTIWFAIRMGCWWWWSLATIGREENIFSLPVGTFVVCL